jgi:hypothetical protein
VPLTDRTLLAGDWLVEGGGYVIEISSDGAYVVAGHADLLVDRGQWTLRGSELTLTSSARSAGCDAGDRLVLISLAGEVLTNIGAQDLQGDVTQNTCDGAWAKSVWVPIPNSRTG